MPFPLSWCDFGSTNESDLQRMMLQEFWPRLAGPVDWPRGSCLYFAGAGVEPPDSQVFAW